ncbi:MAG: hypothetical protein AB7S41_20165 [Parvibaculaceae bacterium]
MRSSPTGARRSLFGVGGGAAIGLPFSHTVPAATAAPIDVGMPCDPGVAVLWMISGNACTTTACQPANDNHPLRTPKGVVPWHSDDLEAADYFEVTLTVPGVHDGFCTPNDVAGRIGPIAGAPRQPGMLSLRFFKDIPETTSRREAPHAAPAIFPIGAGTAHAHSQGKHS